MALLLPSFKKNKLTERCEINNIRNIRDFVHSIVQIVNSLQHITVMNVMCGCQLKHQMME